MFEYAKPISAPSAIRGCPRFIVRTDIDKKVTKASLRITSFGVYAAYLDGARIGRFELAPGWTCYAMRLQVQRYGIDPALFCPGRHELAVDVAGGWYSGTIARGRIPEDPRPALVAELKLNFEDDTTCVIATDSGWMVRESQTTYADIYHGEHFDATLTDCPETQAEERDFRLKKRCIDQEGPDVVRMEELKPVKCFVTPKGERVLDFGQEITGYVQMRLKNASAGQVIRLTCCEMLDRDGNFYNENYRSARSEMVYTCKDGSQEWHPTLTYYGFRYIRVEGLDDIDPEDFTGVVLSSEMQRTGFISTPNPKLNKLCENIVWSQKCNFLDIPTDCPQRDERLGWTGDAQVFMNTACYQFNAKKFFTKWLSDMVVEQRYKGSVPLVIPSVEKFDEKTPHVRTSAGWGDAAVICPWELYRHYGDGKLLRSHYQMIMRWISFVESTTTVPGLWIGYEGNYGDWLGLDAEEGSYTGASRKDFIASAFYYHALMLAAEVARAINRPEVEIEPIVYKARDTRKLFNLRFPDTDYRTQTEYAVSLCFGLPEDKEMADDAWLLAKLVRENGYHLTTGFLGTPYLLYALSRNGQTETAYSLLLQEDYPSWLYEVNQGATTVWEHWDGKKPDGTFWSADMNSFNHYAYGSVAGWLFEEAGGITPYEPGFKVVKIDPRPDPRLSGFRAELITDYGRVVSSWRYVNGEPEFCIENEMPAYVMTGVRGRMMHPGKYIFTK